MSYAALALYLDADAAPVGRVRIAASLAQKFNATLTGISALGIRPPFVAEGVVIEKVTEADITSMQEKLAARERWFRETAGAQVKLAWRGLLEPPNDALAREARSADLVVIGGSRRPGDFYSALDPGSAILRMGRPTLVVPDGADTLTADHIVIGWKDMREARRAVWDALPFLHEASRVTIVEVCATGQEEAAQSSLDAVSQYLLRHRIKSGPLVILHREGSDAAQLIRVARDEKADLLVTGPMGTAGWENGFSEE